MIGHHVAAIGLALALAATASGSTPPDLPGLGLDKVSWGMNVAEIKQAYPALGSQTPVAMFVGQAPELSTQNFSFAGCQYDLEFTIGDTWLRAGGPPLPDDGLWAVELTLQSGQADDCWDKALDYLTNTMGPSWKTKRSEVYPGPAGSHPVGNQFAIGYRRVP